MDKYLRKQLLKKHISRQKKGKYYFFKHFINKKAFFSNLNLISVINVIYYKRGKRISVF